MSNFNFTSKNHADSIPASYKQFTAIVKCLTMIKLSELGLGNDQYFVVHGKIKACLIKSLDGKILTRNGAAAIFDSIAASKIPAEINKNYMSKTSKPVTKKSPVKSKAPKREKTKSATGSNSPKNWKSPAKSKAPVKSSGVEQRLAFVEDQVSQLSEGQLEIKSALEALLLKLS